MRWIWDLGRGSSWVCGGTNKLVIFCKLYYDEVLWKTTKRHFCWRWFCTVIGGGNPTNPLGNPTNPVGPSLRLASCTFEMFRRWWWVMTTCALAPVHLHPCQSNDCRSLRSGTRSNCSTSTCDYSASPNSPTYAGIYTIIKTTSVGRWRGKVVGGGRGWLAGDTDGLDGWPVTVGVVEVGVVNTRYGVSQPGADAERYRCACLHWGWLGVVTDGRISVWPRLQAF